MTEDRNPNKELERLLLDLLDGLSAIADTSQYESIFIMGHRVTGFFGHRRFVFT